MITANLYLDTRVSGADREAPLKIAISAKGSTAYISTDIKLHPSCWDATLQRVVLHPNKNRINAHITSQKLAIDRILLDILDSGSAKGKTATEVKYMVLGVLDPERYKDGGFAKRYLAFAETKTGRTNEVYMATYKHIVAFIGNDTKLRQLSFEDITVPWLKRFEAFLAQTSPSKNARNIHLRNIRAVFNDAIDDEFTHAYPFRKFKIRPVQTAKRSMTVEQLRRFMTMPVEPYAEQYRDMFMLIFYLVGINIIDLCNLKDIVDGRIEYNRAKTKRHYSIKVEPEAMAIIEKYRGRNYLLNIMDRHKSHRNYTARMNNSLKRIGDVKRVGYGGKKIITPAFPDISTYWARHTWATIAAKLDVPKETIAAALGHGGNTVTDIYIDFDMAKVDVANRKVIDYVLYNKV